MSTSIISILRLGAAGALLPLATLACAAPAPTIAPTATPTPAPTATPTPEPVPTCDNGRANCSPRDVSGISVVAGLSSGGAAFDIAIETPSIEEVLEKGYLTSARSPVHIAARGVAQPRTFRCDWRGLARTAGQREDAIRFWLGIDEDETLPSDTELRRQFMTYVNDMEEVFRPTWEANISAMVDGGLNTEYVFLICYAQYTVIEYLLGAGPRNVSVAYETGNRAPSYGLYSRSYAVGALGDDEQLSESELTALRDEIAVEAAAELERSAGNRESVVFLAPLGANATVAVESWQVVEQWDIQLQLSFSSDPTRLAVRYGVPQDDPEYSLPYADLKRRVATAAGSDAFAGKRIANASGITQYYRDIGAYGDITPGDGETATFTPAQPPPRCGSAVANHAANPGLVQDCMVLLAAKDELRGTRSLNWSESLAIADWDGVKTTGTPARVTQVRLVARRFTGTIPSSLGKLPALTRLFLNGNELTGTIPPELGGLAALEQLRLNDNDLTGALPAELGELANLRELWISDNALTGAIPSELGSLSKLEVLSLLNNGLTGSIPSELGSLSKLTQLSLSNNALTGSIPTELANLRSLAWLRLGGNALTGCVPSSLRSVADHDLHRLRGFSNC